MNAYVNRYKRTETEDAVLSLMHKGLRPSTIDRRLKLAPGEAHDTMVRLWKLDDGRRGAGVLL